MLIQDGQKRELMVIKEIGTDGPVLVIKGRIMGAMPMTARITPSQARAGLKLLLKPGRLWFLLTFLFRKDP
jgi:hypothetical protein